MLISIVVRRDEGRFVAHALDFDLMAAGSTVPAALESLREVVATYIAACQELGLNRPEEWRREAPNWRSGRGCEGHAEGPSRGDRVVCGRCLAQEHEWNELEERGPGWWVCPKCGAELLLSDVEEADDDFASARELFEDELRLKNQLRRPGSSHSAKVKRKRPRPKPEPWYRRGFE